MANAIRVSINSQAKRDRRVRIRILNAPDGHKNTTGLDQAARYVAAGRATWNDSGTSITFHEVGIHLKIGYDSAARTGTATVEQLRGLPVLGNLTKLITIARRTCV